MIRIPCLLEYEARLHMGGLFGAGGALAFGELVFGEADARLGDLEFRDVACGVATPGEGGPGVDLDAGEGCALALATRLLDYMGGRYPPRSANQRS